MLAARLIELRALAADKALTRPTAQTAITELCDALQVCQRRREKPKFTLADVLAEAERMKWPRGLAEQCNDTYERVGWMTGKNPIVSLPAAMRTWMRNHQKWNGNGKSPGDGKTLPAGWADFLKAKGHHYKGKFNYAPEWMRLEFAKWKKEDGRKKDATLL